MKNKLEKILTILLTTIIFVGCSTNQPNKFDPYSPREEEKNDFAKFKLLEKTNPDESLIYIVNKALDERQSERPIYLSFEEKDYYLSGNSHVAIKTKSKQIDIYTLGECAFDTKPKLKLAVLTFKEKGFVKGMVKSPYNKSAPKDQVGKMILEPGKTYFLHINSHCFLNRYEKAMNIAIHTNAIMEENGKYLIYKTDRE